MRKVLLMLLLLSSLSLAQSYMTTVTANVTDSTGTPYNSCVYSAALVNNTGKALTLGGTPLPPQMAQVTGTQCSSAGAISQKVVSNTALLPAGSQWKFTICDRTNSSCFNVQTTITGTTQDISALIKAAAPVIAVNNNSLVRAGSNLPGTLDHVLRLQDIAGNDLIEVLSDPSRAGGLRRPPTNATGSSQGIYIFDKLAVEMPAWFDESIGVTSSSSPITTSTLAQTSNIGDTVLHLSSVPGDWVTDMEIEVGTIGVDRESRSIICTVVQSPCSLGDGLPAITLGVNDVLVNYPMAFQHLATATVSRFRHRGAIGPVTANSLTPGGFFTIGFSLNALEASTRQQTINQATHVKYVIAGLSNIVSHVAFGGDVSAGTGMAVNVNGGIAIVQQNAGTGSPPFAFQATTQNGVTIAAADPTNARIDNVYWDDWGVVRVVTGTPAGSPVAPATPTNGTKLYEVTVPALCASSACFTLADKRANYTGFFPADPANQGARLVRDSTGRYIRARVSGTPVWALGAFDQNDTPQVLQLETGVKTTSLQATGQITTGSGNNVITTATGLLDATKLSGTVPITNGGIGQTSLADGANIKHKRVATCTTSNVAFTACNTTVTWTTAFADANYTVSCGLEATTAQSHVANMQSKIAASVVVGITTEVNIAASGTLDCIAIHD